MSSPPPPPSSPPPPPPSSPPPPSPPPPRKRLLPQRSPPPPPPDTTNKTASQAPPFLASPSGSPGPAGPSPPVLSALIVGVVLCVLAGLGISVCVYRRKKRKEAQTLLQPGIFAEHPSTSSSMGSENGRPTMNWSKTMRIAVGVAKGLSYLHEDCQPKIIHRDIKASNILIDNSFEAKVADFGLAKHYLDTETHVSTRVMGTFGTHSYIDDSIVDWARPLLKQALEDGNLDAVVDPKLQDYDFNEMTRMIWCAAACVRHLGRFRPRMSQIVRALEGNMPLDELDELNEGITTGFSMVYISASSDYNTRQ
ncbi:PROLINE-RICH RECEPTOR-LIKE PROTEIN KINASE PERK15 [Salix koriyanagi]|uniref:non-specific serine/threonine protein kinase n=1 Tax=Salix koriyanagi TaxID=2511006 RepID=A0A9Q0Q6Q4_9ROSI|nr:PROLINE-RICH RECEPTOR-LIKE PROTEIN KINASE PERK15 [Salix koriyanagi]